MRDDLQRPLQAATPLVGGVERTSATAMSHEQDRDEEIILALRRKLKDRNMHDTMDEAPKRKGRGGEEDKYEPQRLSRKICWQYDVNAKKVPLLRRHYI